MQQKEGRDAEGFACIDLIIGATDGVDVEKTAKTDFQFMIRFAVISDRILRLKSQVFGFNRRAREGAVKIFFAFGIPNFEDRFGCFDDRISTRPRRCIGIF